MLVEIYDINEKCIGIEDNIVMMHMVDDILHLTNNDNITVQYENVWYFTSKIIKD